MSAIHSIVPASAIGSKDSGGGAGSISAAGRTSNGGESDESAQIAMDASGRSPTHHSPEAEIADAMRTDSCFFGGTETEDAVVVVVCEFGNVGDDDHRSSVGAVDESRVVKRRATSLVGC